MKNIILPALLAAVAVCASGAAQAQSTGRPLAVHGQLLSGTCTLSLSSAEIEFKNPRVTAIGTTFEPATTAMAIECPGPTRFGLTYTEAYPGMREARSTEFRLVDPASENRRRGEYSAKLTDVLADGVSAKPTTVNRFYGVVGTGFDGTFNHSRDGWFMILGRHLAVTKASATITMNASALVFAGALTEKIELVGGMNMELIYL